MAHTVEDLRLGKQIAYAIGQLAGLPQLMTGLACAVAAIVLSRPDERAVTGSVGPSTESARI